MTHQDFNIDGKELRIFPLNENYAVSIDGDVYSFVRKKWMSKHVNRHGYFFVNIKTQDKKSTQFFLHRVVLMSWVSLPPEGKNDVNHIDGKKHNNHVSNLEWNNRRENIAHAVKNGLWDAQKKAITEKNKKDWAEGKKRNAVELGALKRKGLVGDKHEQSKKIINKKTKEVVICVRILAERLNTGYSTLRSKLNGNAKNNTEWEYLENHG